MLTQRQKELLLRESKAKASQQREIMCGDFKIESNYLRQIHKRTKDKTKKALNDLIFLAENYPEYVYADDLLKLVSAKLAHGTITLKERQRKPKSMRSKKYKPWIKVAGVLHNEDGSPLRKPEIHNKVWLAFKLLQAIEKSISSLHFTPMQVTRLVKDEEKIDLIFSLLATEKGIKPFNNNYLTLSDIIRSENHALLNIEEANPENLSVVIIEDRNKNHKKL
ncbi:MAG: hypothetical protein NWF05_11010 [Candidatus Bathyarchaeota archaeon]|nr:hypothetical protein [Candidatus Bathyarchaeota archaeon]